MQILVNTLINSLPFELSYFLKLLSQIGVKSRIILDSEDIIKLREYFEAKASKSVKCYQAYIVVRDLEVEL